MYTSGNGGKVYTQDMSFIFTEPGQLGIELTRSAVTGVTGQAEKLGVKADDQFLTIDGKIAEANTNDLIKQLQALPRPGVIQFRRAIPIPAPPTKER